MREVADAGGRALPGREPRGGRSPTAPTTRRPRRTPRRRRPRPFTPSSRTRPFLRWSSAVEVGHRLVRDAFRLVEQRLLLGRGDRPAEPAPEEVRAHEPQPRIERARVDRDGTTVLGDRAVDLERRRAVARRALAPAGVVRVAGGQRLGQRGGRIGRGRRRAGGRGRRGRASVRAGCHRLRASGSGGRDGEKRRGYAVQGSAAQSRLTRSASSPIPSIVARNSRLRVPHPLHELGEGRLLPVHQDADPVDPGGDPDRRRGCRARGGRSTARSATAAA